MASTSVHQVIEMMCLSIMALDDLSKELEIELHVQPKIASLEKIDLHPKAVRAGVDGGVDKSDGVEWFLATAKETFY